MNIIQYTRNLIFGHDIFISYSRKDSLDYAYAIARHFMKPEYGYDCYIDQLSSTTPGKQLPKNIITAISKSTALVIVGSEGATKSEAIGKEVKTFKEQNSLCRYNPRLLPAYRRCSLPGNRCTLNGLLFVRTNALHKVLPGFWARPHLTA